MATLLVGGGLGCQRHSANGFVPAPLSPEESFDVVYQAFRRGMDTGGGGVMAGGKSRDESGVTAMTVNNTVTRELIPPKKDGDPYRATITVEHRSLFSRVPTPGASGSKGDDSGGDQATGGSDTATSDPGVDVIDSNLIGSSSKRGDSRRGTRPTTAGVPPSRSDEDVRTYELVYEEGRWKLLTKIDTNVDAAAQNAFDYALSKQ